MKKFLLATMTSLLLSVLKIVCLLIAIAYFTLAERKIMAAVQRRVGPNVVGPFGLLQPLADGLKLAGKELAIPAQASSRIFLTVAVTVLLFALSGWSTIPFGMFDHSEQMSTETLVKILILSEPVAAQECLSCRIFPEEDGASNDTCEECEDCDDSEENEDDSLSALTKEERDWVNREIMRYIQMTEFDRGYTPTEEEQAERVGRILLKLHELVEFVKSRHE